MSDPNRWQPLQIEHMISQNGIPVTNGVQQAVGPHWGHVTTFAIPAGGAAGVPIDPGPPPQLGDPATDQAYKDAGRRGHPRQQPARPVGRRDDRHLAGRPRQQRARDERRPRPTGQPGDRAAVRAGGRQHGRLRPRAGRVLGRRPEVRDAARALERHRQHRLRRAGAEPQDRGNRDRGRPARVGRQALPRAQRRGPRCRDRGLGAEGPLRLGPADLDDPVHGVARPVERSRTARRYDPEGLPLVPGLVE